MAPFELEVGSPRLGWLVDGDPDTPHTLSILEDIGSAINLRIAWTREVGGHMRRWFHGDWVGDSSAGDSAPPGVLWFQDSDGIATLVGCRPSSSRGSLGTGLGEGVIEISYAVLDTGQADYRTISGLRSEIDGLTGWLATRPVTDDVERDADGGVTTMRLTLHEPDTIHLTRSLNLCLRRRLGITPSGNGDFAVHEAITVESLTRKPRPWADHLTLHNGLRDLVAIARWRLGQHSGFWATRDDDPFGPPGRESRRWNRTRTYRVIGSLPADRSTFMFWFDDVGSRGFGAWLRLRKQFARGINPLLATLNPLNAGLEANLALSSIGLDGIGYQLALDDGLSRGRAKSETHQARLLRVADEIPYDHNVPVDEWAQRSADANHGLKHADRDLPDVLTMANTLRENSLIFRLWLTHRLGVPASTIDRSLSVEPQTTAYKLLS